MCPSSKLVTRSRRSCTSISRVSDSTPSCGALGLTGETEIPLTKCPAGDGSGEHSGNTGNTVSSVWLL